MRIAITGSGAVGSLVGGMLTASGQDVIMLSSRKEYVDLVNQHGQTICIVNTGERIHVEPRMVHVSEVNSLPQVDLVVCCAKSYGTKQAIMNALPLITTDTYIMSLQNGWGNVEQIKEVVSSGGTRIIAGVFYSLVTPDAEQPNYLRLVQGTSLIKAGAVDQIPSPKIREIADVFNRAGLDCTLVDNYVDIIWNKLIGNTAMPVAAVLGLTNDELLMSESTRALVTRIFEESIAVARELGVNFDCPEDPLRPHLAQLQKFMAGRGQGMRGSMPLDVINGRKTEIDAINGAVVTEGRKKGIPTPVNECLVLMVKAMEERNIQGKIFCFDRKVIGIPGLMLR